MLRFVRGRSRKRLMESPARAVKCVRMSEELIGNSRCGSKPLENTEFEKNFG